MSTRARKQRVDSLLCASRNAVDEARRVSPRKALALLDRARLYIDQASDMLGLVAEDDAMALANRKPPADFTVEVP